MDFLLTPNYNSVICTAEVYVAKPCTVRVEVVHPTKPFTKYTDREHTIEQAGKATFNIRMPQTPEKCILKIRPIVHSMNDMHQLNMQVPNPKLGALKKALNQQKFQNAKVISFLKFAQPFCENAGIMSSADSIYLSDDWQFRIDYKDCLPDDQGRPTRTPARISATTGHIELNKERFLKYTVPMRMAIILHEFAHVYVNERMDDEVEADKNAMLIYLGLGYPRIDGLMGFNEIFQVSPSEYNFNRWQALVKFVDEFEKRPFYLAYM